VKRIRMQDSSVGNCSMTFTRRFISLKFLSIEVGGSNVLPPTWWMVHIGQAGPQILFQALHQGREDPPVLLGKVLRLSCGLQEIGGVVDPVEPGLDQGPFDLGAFDLEIRHLVEKAALMLTVREHGPDSGHDSGTASRGDHPDSSRIWIRFFNRVTSRTSLDR
jgi:hypothetical protein